MISKEKFHALANEWKKIETKADRENRHLTEAELGRTNEICKLLDEFHGYMNEPMGLSQQQMDTPGGYGPEKATPAPAGRYAKGAKYADLFPNITPTLNDWRSSAEYIQTIGLHRGDPRLSRRAYTEGAPGEGGFLVPSELEREIFDIALESEIVRPRARNIGMISSEKHIPASSIGDHSENTHGGVTSTWTSEAAELTESAATMRRMTLTANKLTCLSYASAEFLEDATEAENLIQRVFAGALSFNLDYCFLQGSGAGQPLGISNSPCLVSVDKATGQAAETIIADNLFEMLSRLHAASFENAVWVAHPGTLPQLAQISVPVGTGGSLHPGALTSFNGRYSLLGKPLIFSEKMNTLGTPFDILLADFSQYVIGIRSGMRFDASTGPKFSSDQVAFRMIIRADGQCMWDEALTLKDGSTTVSPFVTLAVRA